jgi:hypothetical protein
LCDQLGLDSGWTSRTKYGATIQTAVDYLITLDPENENMQDSVPHVAAAAAAYGDPTGKYKNFLTKADPNYTASPYWFYDQTQALPNSPAANQSATSKETREEPYVWQCPEIVRLAGPSGCLIDNNISVTCNELFKVLGI